MTTKPIIVIDIDGPLQDYNAAYATHWERVFGEKLVMANPRAYWAASQWNARRLKGAELDMFTKSFDEEFWATIPATEHAVKDVAFLAQDYRIMACTTSDPKYSEVRKQRLLSQGFKIEEVFSVGKHPDSSVNPKASVINSVNPAMVIDDLPLGLKDLNPDIVRVLFARAMRDPRHPKNLPGAFTARYRVTRRLATAVNFLK